MTASLWVLLPPAEEGVPSALLINTAGNIIARGSLANLMSMDFDRCIAVVPGTEVALARLAVPDGTRAQMQSAGRLLMEDIVALHDAAYQAFVAPTAHTDGLRWVAHAPKETCRRVLEQLSAFQLDPDVVVPAAALLPAPQNGYVMADYFGITIARTTARGFAAESDLVGLMLEGEGPKEALGKDDFERAICNAANEPRLLNLRAGAFAKARGDALQPGWFRRAAILAACAAVLLPIVPLIEGMQYRAAMKRSDEQTFARVKAALPDAPRIVNARAQLDERMQALGLNGSPVDLLAQFTRTLSRNSAAVAESVLVSARGDLTATLIIADQTQLEAIAQQLRQASLDVEAGTIRVTADGPRAELVIRGR